MIKLITIIFVILGALLGGIGALYLKKASKKFELKIKILLDIDLIAGLFFYFLAAVIVIFLLKFNEISFVYPLTALVYVFVTIFSWKYLNENVNMYKIISIALIVIGVALVAMS